jgi:hypothetical protein
MAAELSQNSRIGFAGSRVNPVWFSFPIAISDRCRFGGRAMSEKQRPEIHVERLSEKPGHDTNAVRWAWDGALITSY